MITRKDVEYVAELARLEFSEEDKENFTKTLNDILKYAEKLNEVDTEEVPPTAHILSVKNVFREDRVRPSMDRDKILQNAPDSDKGCFRVPRVIE
ncbi:MAG: Aspartyl/glutamyl-tRNA(Asn/Gln) amidotransferase subunit C [Firmicutes bacterium]|nr:Aspartyl/glutamyl-tRNA(Asn/Gln) amidotransferase subunit C [Bacillota bacterium]MDI6706833.1 Asp-tRNA(Asn)/Glu-tRNA(Gln) amidotransferase subunit GatC [Bacillota bacterium]